ncbi:MAG: class I SAM-dependent methyltransferase [Bacteroidota bacterium]
MNHRKPEQIQKDFDRIAALEEHSWNHNSHYHKYLIKHLPGQSDRILEIGCGKGRLSREIAGLGNEILGIDLSPKMIASAIEQSKGYSNLTYTTADYFEVDFGVHSFDAIISVATIHHMDLGDFLKKAVKELKPGGQLLILDLFEETGLIDSLLNWVAMPVSKGYKFIKNGRITSTTEEDEAWMAHGQHDEYMTIKAIKAIGRRMLPGAKIKRHLLWRYSIIWEKPIIA